MLINFLLGVQKHGKIQLPESEDEDDDDKSFLTATGSVERSVVIPLQDGRRSPDRSELGPTSPMMMGGVPGMGGLTGPQLMYAARQAAQAYQQAILAFSVAGSQVGEGSSQTLATNGVQNVNDHTGVVGVGATNPAMMSHLDSWMSMFGMGEMGMGMPPPPPMEGQIPSGLQTTDMSTFDPRASPRSFPTQPAPHTLN
jgi:hypothetical protein